MAYVSRIKYAYDLSYKKNPNLAKTKGLRGLFCLLIYSLFLPLWRGHAGLTDHWPKEHRFFDVLASKFACCSQDSSHKNKYKTGLWSGVLQAAWRQTVYT